jgi:hypothetical protein
MFQIRRANLERGHGCRSVWFLATLIHTVASARLVHSALAVLNRLNGFDCNNILGSVTCHGTLCNWFEKAKGAKCNSLGQRPQEALRCREI